MTTLVQRSLLDSLAQLDPSGVTNAVSLGADVNHVYLGHHGADGWGDRDRIFVVSHGTPLIGVLTLLAMDPRALHWNGGNRKASGTPNDPEWPARVLGMADLLVSLGADVSLGHCPERLLSPSPRHPHPGRMMALEWLERQGLDFPGETPNPHCTIYPLLMVALTQNQTDAAAFFLKAGCDPMARATEAGNPDTALSLALCRHAVTEAWLDPVWNAPWNDRDLIHAQTMLETLRSRPSNWDGLDPLEIKAANSHFVPERLRAGLDSTLPRAVPGTRPSRL